MIAPKPATADDIAEWLEVPRRTVIYMAIRGEIPGARKLGRRWFFPPVLQLARMMFPEDRDGCVGDVDSKPGKVEDPGTVGGAEGPATRAVGIRAERQAPSPQRSGPPDPARPSGQASGGRSAADALELLR